MSGYLRNPILGCRPSAQCRPAAGKCAIRRRIGMSGGKEEIACVIRYFLAKRGRESEGWIGRRR